MSSSQSTQGYTLYALATELSLLVVGFPYIAIFLLGEGRGEGRDDNQKPQYAPLPIHVSIYEYQNKGKDTQANSNHKDGITITPLHGPIVIIKLINGYRNLSIICYYLRSQRSVVSH